MQSCLETAGIFAYRPLAVSLGGEGDTGQDMSPEGRALLLEKIQKTGFFFINESSLEVNVKLRMRLYEENAGASPVKAFINIGGSWANVGTDPSVLKLEPGLSRVNSFPIPGKRGVLQEMASLGIPVIHLLHIKGVAQRYGLPWDPHALPRPGEGAIYRLKG
jgi:poly-gamma-glutamate system protein